MIDQPKEIKDASGNVIGREATLVEFVTQQIQDPNHLVRRELNELQRAYLEMPKLQSRINELENQVNLKNSPPIPEISSAAEIVHVPEAQPQGSTDWPRKPCPLCSKEISTNPAGWKSHMRNTHKLAGAGAPKP